ncbi:MAG: hypothetical protein M3N43_08925 [Actinomycetota bacterium]|nr:hypothetical protein [Actinomycetota bacterium]
MSQEAVPTSLLNPAAWHMPEWHLHWLFRLALCAEFVGHGAFGVMTKQAWVPYFTLFGLPEAWAWTLMPVVGSIDITLGLLALLAPTRAGLLYMGCWGLFTAMLRPLAGEGGWEFLERSYNFGVPFLMLWVHGVGTTARSWFTVLTEIPRLTAVRAQRAQWALRGIMAGMLIGHGAFGLLMGKANLLQFYDAAGFGVFGVLLPTLSAAIGGFEMLLGVLCLMAMWPAFFVFVCAWKLGTEFLYVPAQAYGAGWEVLERGSSYAAPLLWIGVQQVLTAHGVTGQGLIPRHWLRPLGSAARHTKVRLPS